MRLFFAKAYIAFCDVLIGVLQPGYDKLERVRNILSYKNQPKDVILVSFPKSGTTWMQMVLYQLFSNGDMNIDHIRNVIPYLEEGGGEQHENLDRRVITSHLSYKDIPKSGAKYIYVMRNLDDVLVSLYHHSKNLGYQGSFEESVELYFQKRYKGGIWGLHVSDWLENKNNLDVHYIKYEDLKMDFENQLDQIISFCGIKLNKEGEKRVIERSHFSFMKKHEEKFDQAHFQLLTQNFMLNNFMRKGEVGDGKVYLDDSHKKAVQQEKENFSIDQY